MTAELRRQSRGVNKTAAVCDSREARGVTLIGVVTFPIHQARADISNHLPDGVARRFKHLIGSHPSSDNMAVGLQLAGC